MIRNEKGFTYPLTFSIILLFGVLITMYIEFHLLEVRFFKESEMILKQEYYLLSSVKRVESTFIMDEDFTSGGVFIFSDGKVTYETSKLTDTLFLTTYSLQIGSIPEILGYSYFDEEEGKMIKWLERN